MRTAPLWLALSSVWLVAGCDSRPVGADSFFAIDVEIFDAETRKPVDGLVVRGTLADGSALEPRVSEVGRSSWKHAAEGLRVVVSDPERRFVTSEATVSEMMALGDEERVLRFELVRGHLAQLRVLGGVANGEPTAIPAKISVWPIEGVTVEESSFPNGDATLGPFTPGDVKLAVSAPGYETAVVDFSVRRREVRLGDLVLRRGGAVAQGRVDTGGRVRATGVAYRSSGVLLETASIDASGHFELSGLPQGRGTLVVRRHRRELFTREVLIDGTAIDLGVVRPEELASSR